MLDRLVQFDVDLFLWLNNHHTPFWDKAMLLISGKWEWIPFYAILLGIILYKYKWKSIWVLLSVIIAVAFADSISTWLIKETIERLRPSHNPELEGLIHVVGKRGGMFGFVSSHAANTFALATFLFLLFRKVWFTVVLLVWATIVSYSRIYLGVHYPADILGGAILGTIIGFLIYRLYLFLTIRYSKQKNKLEYPDNSYDKTSISERP